jgi:hypothetical protein
VRTTLVASVLLLLASPVLIRAEANVLFSGDKKRNNLVSDLLEIADISGATNSFQFTRPSEGWVFVSATWKGTGAVKVVIDNTTTGQGTVPGTLEAVRYVAKGEHQIRLERDGDITIDKLTVIAVPELIHCGLGYNPAIKSYGLYDMEFLRKDILPNITTLVVPHNIKLPQTVIDDWHGRGKRFVAEVGINSQAKTAAEHLKYWTGFLDAAPFADGIIVNEFIVNNPSARPGAPVSAERQKRMKQEQERYKVYEEAIKQLRASDRYKDKTLYAYVGGSGKKLNQEIIGPTFIRTLMDCNYRIALERYIYERSSEKTSEQALQEFADGIADWEAKQPGVRKQVISTFGLFSMPPGSINKLPNVDYHVWMDQQMHVAATDPRLAGLGGLEWWTSLMADEETVRFVGKLYRHYAIEGKTGMLTRDPLFLPHLRNPDFQDGLEGWDLRPAEEGTIQAKGFPRYGRIEGRYMGLGRPADPEHIGDHGLWMKRSAKGANRFSQKVKKLEPGRLYSFKMLSCDYNDLVQPKKKTMDEANKFIGQIHLRGVEVDPKRSFSEMYLSNPEPPIPVWITYHWKVFRPHGTEAELVVSDWDKETKPTGPFGQEQIFNFIEIQPYHE